MKKIFFSAIFSLLFAACFGQGQIIEKAVVDIVDRRISGISLALFDSIIVTKGTTVGAVTLNLDTLIIPVDSTAVFQISITNKSGGDVGSGVRIIQIKNISGVYQIVRNYNLIPYFGQATISKAVLNVVMAGSFPVVQVTGVAGTTIKWASIRGNL